MNRILAAVAIFAFASFAAEAADADRPQQLVNEARTTLDTLFKDGNIGPNLKSALTKAKGVMIVPTFIKGGFIVGGAGGSGVLLAKLPDGSWSQPAFVTVGEASIGLQIGGSVSEFVFVINNDKALDAMITKKVTIGADLELAAGPFGANIGAQTAMSAGKDIWAFARSQGLFAGGAFDGAYIEPRNDWNALYYLQKIEAKQITATAVVGTMHDADELRVSLQRLSAGTM
jgi:SH3 domain-containing YSC84-like protein 1